MQENNSTRPKVYSAVMGLLVGSSTAKLTLDNFNLVSNFVLNKKPEIVKDFGEMGYSLVNTLPYVVSIFTLIAASAATYFVYKGAKNWYFEKNKQEDAKNRSL